MLLRINYSHDNAIANMSRSGAARKGVLWILIAIWSSALAIGMGWLAAYANTPGKWTPAPAAIETSNDVTSAQHRLYMFLHPHCPCSVASVNELDRIMSRCAAQLDATVYFLRPESKSADWERGRLWNLASSIPNLNVKTDVGGRIAARFNAHTSGQVLVYDRLGKLCFDGGITGARGHAGDNLGQSAIIAIALEGESDVERSPVFGCPFRAEVVDSRN